MFFEVEGRCTADAMMNGVTVLNWSLPHSNFRMTVPSAMLEGSHMNAEWSLRFHHDDPDADIFCRRLVRRITLASDYFRISFVDCPEDLIFPESDADAAEGFAQHFTEGVWIELVELAPS